MFCLLGSMLMFVGGAQVAAPTPHVTQADVAELVREYHELGLPLPPPDAPLVEVGRGLYSNGGPLHERIRCGYRISKPGVLPEQDMTSTVIWRTDAVGVSPRIEPTVQNAASLVFNSFGGLLPCPEDFGLVIAVTESTRGHDEFALAILQRAMEDESVPRGYSELPKPPTISPSLCVRYLALAHWINSTVDPRTDRVRAFQNLSNLVREHPEMKNDFVNGVLRSLNATITDRYRGGDGIERLIDALCNAEVDGTGLQSPDPSWSQKFLPLINLVNEGYAAIPKLLDHADDERYTRATSSNGMSTPHLVTVGEVCMNLASQFAPASQREWNPERQRAKLDLWWEAESKLGERQGCRRRLLQEDDFLPDAPIRLAEHKFPSVLLEVYNDILRKGAKTQTYGLLEAMERSNLPRDVIIAAAVRGSSSRILDHVHSAQWTLSRLDKPQFDAALIRLLGRLPRTCTGPPWLSREASFAQQVGYSDSPLVWASLAAATRRADVDLRLELLNESSMACHSKIRRREFLKYVAGFFGDTADASGGPSPTGHFGLPTERVQDLAVCLAADELAVSGKPDRNADRAEWVAFRRRVQAVVDRHLDSPVR